MFKKITLSVNNIPLKKVFQLIEEQTGYIFVYETDWLDDSKRVTFELKDASIFDALVAPLRSCGSVFCTIVNKQIIIKPNSSENGPQGIQPTLLNDSFSLAPENLSVLDGSEIPPDCSIKYGLPPFSFN